MATMITEDCISCGACESECPNEAIREGDAAFVINVDLCTECVGFHGAEACQDVCPVECCIPDPAIREEEATLHARAMKIHEGGDVPALDDLDEETSRFRNDDWDNTGDGGEPAEPWAPLWED